MFKEGWRRTLKKKKLELELDRKKFQGITWLIQG